MVFLAKTVMIAGVAMIAVPAMGATPAAEPTPACPAKPAALPPKYAGWSRAVRIVAGGSAARAGTVRLGAGVSAILLPTPKVTYALRPEKPGGTVSSGGLLAFTVPTAGRYRIALGSAAWIDVVQNGKASVSTAHGHGPACSGIHKIVDFDLAAGRALLQIAGNGTSTLSLMVMTLP